ncbi:MAG: hypothetical protein R3A13_12345 [Bdellovibrionota bacterium]
MDRTQHPEKNVQYRKTLVPQRNCPPIAKWDKLEENLHINGYKAILTSV